MPSDNSDWVRLSLRLAPAEEEVAAAFFWSLGASGVEVVGAGADVEVAAYWLAQHLPPDEARAGALSRLEVALGRPLSLTVQPVPDRIWEEAYLERFSCQEVIPGFFTVRPGVEAPGGAVSIVLEPGAAFGTGDHATTTLALRGLVAAPLVGQTVLDVGCGSGILALFAARMGAGSVFALDVDPVAVEAARRAAAANALAVDVRQGTLGEMELPAADVLVMNIVADVLLSLFPAALQSVRPGGRIVLSGIATGRLPELLEAASGQRGIEVAQQGPWRALSFMTNGPPMHTVK